MTTRNLQGTNRLDPDAWEAANEQCVCGGWRRGSSEAHATHCIYAPVRQWWTPQHTHTAGIREGESDGRDARD